MLLYNYLNYPYRLNNFKITASPDLEEWAVCGTGGDVSKLRVVDVSCPTFLPTRYARVSIPGQYLVLCEVQVFGYGMLSTSI